MARWEPDAQGRLLVAAMALYRERGFDETTVADISERAGVTERTFFRYFADKREVLFGGSDELKRMLVEHVAAAKSAAAPLETVLGAFEAISPMFAQRAEFARARMAIIRSHPELMERELIKLASLASALRTALQERGVPALKASLAAESGITVFRIGFEAWVNDAKKRDLAHHLRATARALSKLRATG